MFVLVPLCGCLCENVLVILIQGFQVELWLSSHSAFVKALRNLPGAELGEQGSAAWSSELLTVLLSAHTQLPWLQVPAVLRFASAAASAIEFMDVVVISFPPCPF